MPFVQKIFLPLILILTGAIILSLSTNLIGSRSFADPPAVDEQLKEVEQTIHDCMGWAVAKDFELFFRTIADDSNFVSVTPYKRVKFGVNDVKNDTGFWASPDFRAIRHELHDLKINFSESGDVA